jgi:hypothetical protein
MVMIKFLDICCTVAKLIWIFEVVKHKFTTKYGGYGCIKVACECFGG